MSVSLLLRVICLVEIGRNSRLGRLKRSCQVSVWAAAEPFLFVSWPGLEAGGDRVIGTRSERTLSPLKQRPDDHMNGCRPGWANSDG
ncbi:unnamed protein product [Protopolystoma xenopodis]|uniref:Uncharacterized protein n=1 Tax=Protopolystoma xenopodis TaxID=117903 RepID=A0A448XHA6_9PLAT|nr:unnamed protein product [Protopolystoma xenopodis]